MKPRCLQTMRLGGICLLAVGHPGTHRGRGPKHLLAHERTNEISFTQRPAVQPEVVRDLMARVEELTGRIAKLEARADLVVARVERIEFLAGAAGLT